jgi:hypothetical protein
MRASAPAKSPALINSIDLSRSDFGASSGIGVRACLRDSGESK